MKKISSLVVLLIFMVSAAGCSDSGSTTSSGGGVTDLSDTEVETLQYMREEEKLARDVYRVLNNVWGLPIFATIAVSEQTHMDTLAGMLDKYGVPDPVLSDSTGSFTNPALASLYQQLVERGSTSSAEAIQVGIFIEETDITDIQRAIEESTHDDLKQAYGNLLQGSYNHLQAFLEQAN